MEGRCCRLCPCPCNEHRANGSGSPTPDRGRYARQDPDLNSSVSGMQSSISSPLSDSGHPRHTTTNTNADTLTQNELLLLRRKLQTCELKCNILEEKIAALRRGAARQIVERLRQEVITSIETVFDRTLAEL